MLQIRVEDEVLNHPEFQEGEMTDTETTIDDTTAMTDQVQIWDLCLHFL